MSGRAPLVSVGLPVYDGERYLREALESILGQTYPNLELVVSDNASRDATEAICREYAARDPRVRYHRVEENRGAVWNFNRVFQLARGEYFMWAAFDDARHPECVARCVAALEANHEAVLCCTGIRLIDEEGGEIGEDEFPHGLRPAGATPAERLRALARSLYWYDFYGLARARALAETRLCRPVWGFDVVLLFELCLRGPVVAVPEKLFSYRIFRKKASHDAAATLGGAAGPGSGAVPANWTEFSLEVLQAVRSSPLPPVRRHLLAAWLAWEFCLRNPVVRSEIVPGDVLRSAARVLGQRRYGAAAGALLLGGLVLPAKLAIRATRGIRWRGRAADAPALPWEGTRA